MTQESTTLVTAYHAGTRRRLHVPLYGHDLERHALTVLDAWLVRTAEIADIDPGEDDRDDWQITSTIFRGPRVVVKAEPYRGEGVTFTFQPPEA